MGVSSLSLTGCLGPAPLCRVFLAVPEQLPSGFPFPRCLHAVSRWRVMAAHGFVSVLKSVPQLCSALPVLCLEKRGCILAVVVRCDAGSSG